MPTTEYGRKAVALTKELIERQSVTPDDAGCQALMMSQLRELGFDCEPMNFEDTQNFWACRGSSGPTLVFAGHTDVVPTGPEDRWSTPPFEATEIGDKLFGRGAADMKAGLAAMLVAVEAFVTQHPNHKGRIAFLITSDEEGPARNGTVKVVETLIDREEKIDWCLVGEPSSTSQLGDVVRVGRRGSINGSIVIHGKQGHIAYPHLAENPIHLAFKALDAIAAEEWDQGNDFFQPTSLQFSNISAGTGASNVIPGELSAQFNVRFSTETTDVQIRRRCEEILSAHGLRYEIEWSLSGQPFLSHPGDLVGAIQGAISAVVGIDTQLSTGGGTSDGRFIARTGAEIVELGPVNASIHQIDEHILTADIPRLTALYHSVMVQLLTPAV